MVEGTCPRKIWDEGGWHSYKCGRPIKENGLCGIHNGADKRRDANDKKRAEAYEEKQAIRSRLNGLVRRLGAGQVTLNNEVILIEEELLKVIDRIGL